MKWAGHEAVYDAGRAFVKRALCSDDSLFTPGRRVWTSASCKDLSDRLANDPNVGGFVEKLALQLNDATADLRQLAAETLYVHLLIVSNVTPAKKREIISLPFAGAAPTSLPDEVEAAFSQGFVNGGQQWNTSRPWAMYFLLNLAIAWKSLPRQQQEELAGDPWAFKKFLETVDAPHAPGQRQALLHLVFPEEFESIVSLPHKQLIAAEFKAIAGDSDDIDRQLAAIREHLAGQYGEDFNFYEPRLRAQWSVGSESWDQFIRWAKKFHEWEGFEEDERTYKLNVFARAKSARDAFLGGQADWLPLLRRAFNPPNNLTPWQAHDSFLRWCQESPEAAGNALRGIWEPAGDPLSGLNLFLDRLPKERLSTPGARLAIGAFLLGATDPTEYPMYRAEPFRKGYSLLQVPGPERDASEVQVYQRALDFLDQICDEGELRELNLEDRLEAQAVLWAVTKNDPPDTWSAAEREQFRAYRGEIPLPKTPIRDAFETILARYADFRLGTTWTQDHELHPVFETLQKDISSLPPIKSRPQLQVTWSAGQGNKTDIPWVVISDAGQTGLWCCAYVFEPDMSGLLLVVSKRPPDSTRESRAAVLQQAKQYVDTHTKYRYVKDSSEEGLADPRHHWQLVKLRGNDGDVLGHIRYANGQWTVNVPEGAATFKTFAEAHAYTRSFQQVAAAAASDVAFAVRYAKGAVPEDTTLAADLDSALQLYDSLVGEVPPSDGQHRILKIAPGEQGSRWDECRTGGYICVGWDEFELGDLRQYSTVDKLQEAIERAPAQRPRNFRVRLANELWMVRELRPGDTIVANRGTSEVLGVGTVTEPGYQWRPERASYKHVVSVNWMSTVTRSIPPQPAWRYSILEVPPDLFALITAPQGPKTISFDSLSGALQAAKLDFSDELLANYLLALQAKRFVILTGISGTGKTQLAMAVAGQLAQRVATYKPKSIPSGAVSVTVRPDMLKRARMMIPARTLDTLDLPNTDTQRRGQVRVKYPEGTGQLPFWTWADRSGVLLYFRDDFRDWFARTFKEGDQFSLDVEEGDEASGDILSFLVPQQERVEAPIDNLAVIAVRPDWTDNRGLLGYFNPLTDEYVTTPFLELLLRAHDELRQAEKDGRTPCPFFAVLDEMNLARVEHYFSDFLSCLESGKPLQLHAVPDIEAGQGSDGLAVPQQLHIPSNLCFVGTVNVDETTYMFSPKVLDRAFTIELDEVDLEGYLSDQRTASPLRLDKFTGLLGGWQKPDATDWEALGQAHPALRKRLTQLNELLQEWHRHFGYRVANEISRFVWLAASQAESPSAAKAAFDIAVLEKVLPKFHGTQQELDEPLLALFKFALGDELAAVPALVDEKNWALKKGRLTCRADGHPDAQPELPRMAAKVWRMRRRLRDQGFTSFIE